MSEVIFPLLWSCEDCGAAVILADGDKPILTGCKDAVPPATVAKLRANKPALIAYLKAARRPVPDNVPFLAKNLDARWLPLAVVGDLGVFWVGERPYWRVTPPVLSWFFSAVEKVERSGKTTPERLCEGAAVLSVLSDWVSGYFPPHEIARAVRQPIRDLPRAVPPPESIPPVDSGAGKWVESWGRDPDVSPAETHGEPDVATPRELQTDGNGVRGSSRAVRSPGHGPVPPRGQKASQPDASGLYG